MGQTSGGEILVRALRRHGARKVFSLPGAELFPVYDECLSPGPEPITGRHEGAVVQSAEGWARATGEVGVALLVVGPGHANGVAGFATASAECSPAMVMSGIDESRHLGRGARQELSQVEKCAPLAKWSAMISDDDRIPESIGGAFAAAIEGFPGPVRLSFPADTLEQVVDETGVFWPPIDSELADELKCADPAQIQAVLDLLELARRPVVIAGIAAFWSNAGPAPQQLVDTTEVPLFTVEQSRRLVSDEHPSCSGDGSAAVNHAAQIIHYADVLVLLGDKVDCRYGHGHAFGKAKVIQICPDASEIGKHYPVRLGLAGNMRVVTEQLLAGARQREWREKNSWLDTLREARQQQRARILELERSGEVTPHPAHVAEAVREGLDASSILVIDGGGLRGLGALLPRNTAARRATGFDGSWTPRLRPAIRSWAAGGFPWHPSSADYERWRAGLQHDGVRNGGSASTPRCRCGGERWRMGHRATFPDSPVRAEPPLWHQTGQRSMGFDGHRNGRMG
jgi:thiamine pyrophosphate-dependent acetolactate synthase large subunit-like protein